MFIFKTIVNAVCSVFNFIWVCVVWSGELIWMVLSFIGECLSEINFR